jgi:hypothetical protein
MSDGAVERLEVEIEEELDTFYRKSGAEWSEVHKH